MAAPYSAHSSRIYVGANAAGYVQSWSYSESVELLEKTSMGDTGRSYESGIDDGNFSCDFLYDPAAGSYTVDLRPGQEQTIVIDIAGDGVAVAPLFSGLVLIESFDINGDLGSMVSASISGKGVLGETTS